MIVTVSVSVTVGIPSVDDTVNVAVTRPVVTVTVAVEEKIVEVGAVEVSVLNNLSVNV